MLHKEKTIKSEGLEVDDELPYEEAFLISCIYIYIYIIIIII